MKLKLWNQVFASTFLVIFSIKEALAVQFEATGKAVAAVLGTTKAKKKTVNVDGKDVTVFYSTDDSGKASKLAFVQEGLYKPNCTHTWIVGVDAKTTSITGIRVVEMACPHAFPTKESSFLDQFTGKGPKDVAELSSDIHGVAKATGTSNLTVDAVKSSIKGAMSLKGQI